MRVTMAALADAATVRDGLLHILGAGVTVLVRPEFPSPAGVVLPIMMEEPAAEIGRSDHSLVIGVRHPDGELQHFGRMHMTVRDDAPTVSDLPALAVEVVPIDQYVLPEPGLYAIEVVLDDNDPVVVHFLASLFDDDEDTE